MCFGLSAITKFFLFFYQTTKHDALRTHAATFLWQPRPDKANLKTVEIWQVKEKLLVCSDRDLHHFFSDFYTRLSCHDGTQVGVKRGHTCSWLIIILSETRCSDTEEHFNPAELSVSLPFNIFG